MTTKTAAPLLTSDAARILNMTPAGVRALVKRGALEPASMTVGGVALFDASSVFALARTRRERRSVSTPPKETR